jgi:drug/metabolite transporter (DMT)-like permease
MKGELAVLVAALIFGASATVMRMLMNDVDPIYLAALFDIFPGLAVLVLYFGMKKGKVVPKLKRHDLLLLLGIAAAGGVLAPVFLNLGILLSSASTTALLMNMEAMFTVLLAFIVLRERMHYVEYVAMVVILLCALVISTNLDLSSVQISQLGSFLVILSTLAWAIDNTLSRMAVGRMDITFIFVFKTLVGGSVLFALVAAMGGSFVLPSTTLNYVVIGSILTLGISLPLFYYGLKVIGAMRTAVIFATASLFGVVVAVLVLGDRVSPLQAAAGAVMFMTVIYMTRAEHLWSKDKPS